LSEPLPEEENMSKETLQKLKEDFINSLKLDRSGRLNINIFYLSLTISILIICAIVIRFGNKIVKMYSPEIANNISNKDQDDP